MRWAYQMVHECYRSFRMFFESVGTNDLSRGEIFLFASIVILFGALFVLLLYAALIRLYYTMGNAYADRRKKEWEPVVLYYMEYLKGPVSLSIVDELSIRDKDWFIFGEFIGMYLDNLIGEERKDLIQLLRIVKFQNYLLKAIHKGNQWERAYAIQYLGLMEYAPARPAIERYLSDPSPILSLTAFEALSHFTPDKKINAIFKYIFNRPDISIPRVSEIVALWGGTAYPVLVSLLCDTTVSSGAKRLIIDILASKRVAESIPAILRCSEKETDDEIIIGCLKAISLFETPDGFPIAMREISSKNWVIRVQAVRALGYVGTTDSIPLIESIFYHDSDFRVRMSAAESLMRFGEKGRSVLENAAAADLNHSGINEDVGKIAAAVLSEKE